MTASSFFSRRRGAGWRPRQGLGFRGRRPSSKISSNMVLAAFAVLFAQHQIIKNSCLAVNVKAISASATSGEVETSVVAKTIRDEPASCSSSNTLSFEFRNLQISKADKIPALRSALSTTGPTTAERHHQADHGVVASASSTSGASSASVELEPPSTIAAAAEGDEDRTLLIAAKPDDGERMKELAKNYR
ncbi:unnamed protein product [Amoebophrya sp. A25]|nr:unnamed protein product [Amoebophrya sp. A25]|eukprot:GSA25T00007119001.1